MAPTTAHLAPLLRDVERIARAAGDRLLPLFATSNRPTDRAGLLTAVRANESAAGEGLRAALEQLRPQAGWLTEELETSALPDGEWWVVDDVEGNVNHVHGLPRWAVSIALVRDGAPVLAVVRQPVGDHTWTALDGGGAHLDGAPLQVSAKRGLDVAVVETGQAEAGQADTYRRIGESVTTMLGVALAVRMQVPSTFPMLSVAAGHTDAFWQYSPNLPGTAAGVLVVREAGGTVTTVDGAPWAPGVDSVVVAAPGVHAGVRDALAGVA